MSHFIYIIRFIYEREEDLDNIERITKELNELKDTSVELFKMGEEGVPTVDEYIEKTLSDGETLGFDGRVVNSTWGAKLEEIVAKKNGKVERSIHFYDITMQRLGTGKEEAFVNFSA